jgi:hypothetical protein
MLENNAEFLMQQLRDAPLTGDPDTLALSFGIAVELIQLLWDRVSVLEDRLTNDLK